MRAAFLFINRKRNGIPVLDHFFRKKIFPLYYKWDAALIMKDSLKLGNSQKAAVETMHFVAAFVIVTVIEAVADSALRTDTCGISGNRVGRRLGSIRGRHLSL